MPPPEPQWANVLQTNKRTSRMKIEEISEQRLVV